ncbi:MAG: hypothetical protein AAGI49_18495 [Bacteroidota bacterium]
MPDLIDADFIRNNSSSKSKTTPNKAAKSFVYIFIMLLGGGIYTMFIYNWQLPLWGLFIGALTYIIMAFAISLIVELRNEKTILSDSWS